MNPLRRKILPSLAVVFLLPAIVFGAPAAPDSRVSLETTLSAAPSKGLKLGFELYGNGWESSVTQSRIAGAEITGEISRPLGEAFTANLGLGLVLEAGMARSRFTDEFRPRQGVRLREASISWKPWEPVTVVAGALDQDRWDAPLLLRRQSYPSAYERFALPFGKFTVAFAAMQSVVTDTSTLQPWGNWSQSLPSFFLERISVEWKHSARTLISVHGSHFAFKDLSHQHAYDAQFLGNSVVGVGPENTNFRYGFQGFEMGAEASVELMTGLSPFIRGDVIWNTTAANGRGLGWSAKAGVLWAQGDRLRFRPSFELFRVESDASPALFSSRVFGHSNRQGWAASLGVELPKSGLRGQVQWVSSDVIAATPLQAGATWLGFQLSMDYDAI